MNLNSAQMKQAMKRMGISQDEIEVSKVIIVLEDKELVFDHPSVSRVKMGGQETFQIAGEYSEQISDQTPEISDDDIQTVMQQTGKSESEALAALQEAKGDLAQAILKLS